MFEVGGWLLAVQHIRTHNAPAGQHPTSSTQHPTPNDNSSVHLSQHNVHAAEDNHDVRHEMAKAQVLENRQVDETRRTHPIAIRIRRAVADEIETELALRSFNAAVGFACFRT